MFYHEKDSKEKYWIWNDCVKWKFGPFKWIYSKNNFNWNIDKSMIDISRYPGYKYSIWIWEKNIFVIDEKWWVEIEGFIPK